MPLSLPIKWKLRARSVLSLLTHASRSIPRISFNTPHVLRLKARMLGLSLPFFANFLKSATRRICFFLVLLPRQPMYLRHLSSPLVLLSSLLQLVTSLCVLFSTWVTWSLGISVVCYRLHLGFGIALELSRTNTWSLTVFCYLSDFLLEM